MTTIYITKDRILPNRIPFELYPTERNLIRAALTTCRPKATIKRILDVGAGDGRWGSVAREFYPNAVIVGVEIRDLPKPKEFDFWYRADFLQWGSRDRFDLIVGNPPYGPEVEGVSTAECFIKRAWRLLLAPKGTMILLLRLAFQSGVARYNGLWDYCPLYKLAVLSRRPSFYDGGTNGTDYGLYIWRKRLNGEPDGDSRKWPTELLIYERAKQPGEGE